MKISEAIDLGDGKALASSDSWKSADTDVLEAIASVVWPEGTNEFIVNPRKKGNGVVAIKAQFAESMHSRGWQVEQPFALPSDDVRPGPIDFQKKTLDGLLLVEWETGNISSSHRALNKIAMALSQTSVAGGALVVPSTELAKYLTDRIGNIRELKPYLDIWKQWAQEHGLMKIYVVTYDGYDADTPLIPKGRDGNAAAYRERIRGLKSESHSLQ